MINKVSLLGRVGKVNIKDLKAGGKMTTIYLATSRSYTDSSGQKQMLTTWHNVNCYQKLAEIAEKYAKVGELVYVEGEVSNKKIEHGENAGQWRYSVTANEIKHIPYNKSKQHRDDNDPIIDLDITF